MVVVSPQRGLNPKLFELSYDAELSCLVLKEALWTESAAREASFQFFK